MKTKKAAEFKKNDRVQLRPEVLKERGYAPSDEVGIIVEGPYNNPQCGPSTYTVNWAKDGIKISDASELKAAPAPRPVDQEMYETLQALRAETQGFIDQSAHTRARALAVIARFEGR